MVDFVKISSIIEGVVLEKEIMKQHTTYKIGGPADFYIYPKNELDIKKLLTLFKSENYPYFIVGKGSNLLVNDKGFSGAIIDLKEFFSDIKFNYNEIDCAAGISMAKIGKYAIKNGLTGFEMLAGIPGTLGGALYMNAGCYGKNISDDLDSVLVVTKEGELKKINKEDVLFSYRKSSLQDQIILRARFSLERGEVDKIKETTDLYNSRRVKSQPLSLPSCGSVFKRPEGYYAGKLIEDSGLKGYSVGGAMVSKKHANFIVNVNHATSEDVVRIIDHVKAKVYDKFSVELEEEVKYLGF